MNIQSISKIAFTIVCVLTICNFAQAQTADDVINKYVENTGGKAKWESVKTLTMKGKQNMGGMEFPATMYQKVPNSFKVEVTFQGKTFLQVVDGKNNTVWSVNPFQGTGEAEKMNPEDSKEAIDDATFEPKFINYDKKGHKVALDGKETIEGTECFKLKLVTKSGETEFHFFDTDSYARIMERATFLSGESKGQVSETSMSDYKEANGLMMPHVMETKVQGKTVSTITITSIKINEPIDDAFFTFPKK